MEKQMGITVDVMTKFIVATP